MSVRKHYIVIGNRRHGYTLQPARKVTTLICKSANIEERFPNDEIPRILSQLPQIIRENYGLLQSVAQTEILRFRVTDEEKGAIEQNARKAGYSSVSAYLRDVALRRGFEGVIE
ncbi:hypothetical protein CL652_02850 [bacterium]|nr:hypothetical protein [bacterium]|tara:strand:- start:7356 stop:7697 length:342 start_codon:yes stop_codon:yes gene_type:complete